MSGFEIERKFLVKDGRYKEQAFASSRIRQGYICTRAGTLLLKVPLTMAD